MSSLGVSVAQAILQREGQSRLTTSSQRLDGAFVSGQQNPAKGGIARGTVGEIVGPPGIGKTTLAYVVVGTRRH
jgi:RecA/RadA recombinase